MPSRRSRKGPSPRTSAGAPARKPSKSDWKSPDQLGYLNSHLSRFISFQTAGALTRFWPRVFDGWHKQWPITPSPDDIRQYGSRENAILTLRSTTNTRVRTWFHNQARPTARSSRALLQLTQNARRKLAPAQAYCAYAWDFGLKEIVEARWEEEKHCQTTAGGGSSATATPSTLIPINFKLKVAKEVYEALPADEKREVEERREEDWKRRHRATRDIEDTRERDEKLALHEQNPPSAAKSLAHVLKNLEDQTGCISHLIIGYIDPRDGRACVQNFSQGEGEGLDFRNFCGADWDDVIEKKFREWAVQNFGETGSSLRSKFLFTNAPPVPQSSASSSTINLDEDSSEALPNTDTAMVDGVEAIEASNSTTLPQHVDAMEVDSEQSTPPPADVQPPATNPESLTNGPGHPTPPQTYEAVQFVSPQMIFGPLQPAGSVTDDASTTSSLVYQPPLISSSPVLAPPVLASPILAPPVLDPRQISVPHQVVVYPNLLESPPAAPPQISQNIVPEQNLVSPATSETPHLISPLVLDSSLPITPDQATRTSAPTVSVSTNPSALDTYKVAPTTRSRRDSFEGAPDIVLTLVGSGYEHSQLDLSPCTFATPPPILSSTTPSAESITPSSREPLGEISSIPTETDAALSDTSLARELTPPLSQLEETYLAIKAPNNSPFAPRIVPDYQIDRTDLPSWLLECGRLDSVLSVEAGSLWEKLITIWLCQERRLGFGLDEKIGATLPLTTKPKILGEYFKFRHNPTKGDSVVLPEFSEEVTAWWSSIQPRWRFENRPSSISNSDYSYILAGGKKGVYLLVLCLAWWDRAHSRNLDRVKNERRAAAAKDNTPVDFSDLLDHDRSWFNLLNDLIFVLELAHDSPVPTPGATGAPSGRKKRSAELDTSPRKKTKPF